MQDTNVLEGKRLLVVDDEPDVLGSLREILDMCAIETAADYETARELLSKNTYDAAILDIMGVGGYELLEITTTKGIPTLMLTAHALSPDNFVKSIKRGAHAYVPKDKMSEISSFLEDILRPQQKRSKKIGRWFNKLEPFFEEKFGTYWKEKSDPEFWKNYY